MTHFPILTMESAPERSKPALKQLEAAFGMIPNIAGVMASSPVLINSLVGLFGNVHGGSFTEPQIQTVLLTDAVTNECAWAVAFHTALGLKAGLDPVDVEAIRERRLPKDGQHAALSLLAKTLIEKRGRTRRPRYRSIRRRRLRQGSRARGHRHCRRVDDHELYRKRYPNTARGAVPGPCLAGLTATT